MNRKSLIVLVAVLAVILAGLLLLVGISQAQNPPPSAGESTAPSETGNDTQPATDPSGEETEPSETEPSEEAVATIPTQDSTEPIQTEPIATLPPDVDVSMGVVEGEESPDLDADGGEHSATTQPTQPTQSTQPTQPTQPSEPLDEDFDITTLTYEGYNSMTGDQQMAVINLFASTEEFMRWYRTAEAKYKAEHPDIEIGDDGYVDGGSIG